MNQELNPLNKENNENEDSERFENIKKQLEVARKKRDEVLDLRMKGEATGIAVDKEDEKVEILLNKLRGVLNKMASEPIETKNETKSLSGYSEKKEREYMSKIMGENNFRDLMRRISESGDLVAKDGHVYTKDYLLGIMSKVMTEGESAINYITRTAGLRDKVKEIFEKQKFENSEKGRLRKEIRNEIERDALEALKNRKK